MSQKKRLKKPLFGITRQGKKVLITAHVMEKHCGKKGKLIKTASPNLDLLVCVSCTKIIARIERNRNQTETENE